MKPKSANNAFWQESRSLYRNTLTRDVLPFWLRHGFDRQFGGISNVIRDDGSPVSHEKFLWSQGRALWTFSAAARRYKNGLELAGFAEHIATYLRGHGRDERGGWLYRLNESGRVLDGDTSIYVDGFVMRGLAEFYALTGEDWALELSLRTWENVMSRLAQPGSYGVAPYVIPAGMKTHGIAMIFCFFGFDLAEIAKERRIGEEALKLADEILRDFYVPSKNTILEFVTLDGGFVDSPTGRACVPGHALEALWFLISIFERSGREHDIPQCCQLIRRHLELAWDDEYGGLCLALDIDGKTPVFWQRADCKPWWVQVEALVATAYAAVYGAEWASGWHRKIQQWAWDRYPTPHGEWRQWLDREGRPAESAALPVKDPFHLPRGLMYLDELLAREPFLR